jgi:hypothetical protein
LRSETWQRFNQRRPSLTRSFNDMWRSQKIIAGSNANLVALRHINVFRADESRRNSPIIRAGGSPRPAALLVLNALTESLEGFISPYRPLVERHC